MPMRVLAIGATSFTTLNRLSFTSPQSEIEERQMTSWQSNLRVGRSLASLSEVDLSPSEFFLSELQVRYGPRALLYRFLHQAQEAVLQRGVLLEFGSFERLVETNQRNSATWRSMVPVLDPRRGPLGSSCFCILGTNGRGEVVATQAARLFDFGKNNLKAEGESGRLLYPTSKLPKGLGVPKSDDLELAFSGAAANRISGRAVYSGAVWYHPDYRGRMLSAIMPRISRALAYGRWNTHYTFSFAETAIAAKGLLARYGYAHFEDGVVLRRDGKVDFEGGLVWMSRGEMLSDLGWFMSNFGSQVDVVPQRRRA
jgi:hypothetical protein